MIKKTKTGIEIKILTLNELLTRLPARKLEIIYTS